MGQLHLDSSISELRYLASKTILIFSDTHLARAITGFMKLFSFGCSSLFSGEIIPYCSRMSYNLFTLSCRRVDKLIARCFLKTASS